MAQTNLTYDKEVTALLIVDPYNDFTPLSKSISRITPVPS